MASIRSNVQIPIDELLEDFHCPVCFEEIERCSITPCGHNFCEKCLKECINRRHACPLCSADCTAEQIVRNLQADSLLDRLRSRRQNAAEDHVAHLVDASLEEAKSDQPHAVASPISAIFRKYTSQMLVQYENYYQQLLSDAERNIHRAAEQVYEEISDMFSNFPNGGDFISENDIKVNGGTVSLRSVLNAPADARENAAQEFCAGCASDGIPPSAIQEIEVKLTHQSEQADLIRNRCNKSSQMLCQSYETYMDSMSPSLFLLPVRITIRLKGRPQFWELQLQNTDRLGSVIDFVTNKFIELNDPIKNWDGAPSFGLQRPVGSDGVGEALEIVSASDALIGELNIQPGTQIHIMNGFNLASEAPEACFTAGFVKGTGQKCDYFRCNQCSLNWVCKGCANQCHRGHEIVAWEKNHVPSYACCYCAKKYACTLENSYKNKRRK